MSKKKKDMVKVGDSEVTSEMAAMYADDANENLANVEDAFHKITAKNGKFIIGNDADSGVDSFEAIILREVPVNIFFKESYDPKDPAPPDCTSLGGVTPDSGVEEPQSESCVKCPHNKYGSGIDQNGKATKGKACQNTRRLVLKVEGRDLPLMMSLAPSSLKGYNAYLKKLSSSAPPVPMFALKTVFDLDRAEDFVKVVVEPSELLTAEEYGEIRTYRRSEEVEKVLKAYSREDTTEEIKEATEDDDGSGEF